MADKSTKTEREARRLLAQAIELNRNQKPKNGFQKFLIILGTIVSFSVKWGSRTVSIVGAILLVYSVFPKISIEPATDQQKNNPLSWLFSLKNEGPTELHHISVDHHVIRADGDVSEENIKISGFNNEIPVLFPGEKTTIPLNHGVQVTDDVSIHSAEILINVRFRPALCPLYKTESFRFKAIKNSDGHPVWIPVIKGQDFSILKK